MFRNPLCTSYNLIVWKNNYFFAFLELKFVSGMFVHCFAGKGAVLLSLYCHYYYYYYHHHYYYHIFFFASKFVSDYFSSLVILGTFLPLNGLKNMMCS